MKLEQIIKTPAENDLYKFSMGQVEYHQFNGKTVTWEFRCRNADVKFTPDMVKEIREQVDAFCGTSFSEKELAWLADGKKRDWIKKDYVDWLRLWRPRREEIHINEDGQQIPSCGLAITAEGTWLNTSLYEVVLLAIVNEVYFAFTYGPDGKYAECQNRTVEKLEKLGKAEYDIGTFSEFGLRRRYSSKFHDWLISYMAEEKRSGRLPGFVGTSNVALAMKYDLTPVGTMAHEFAMVVGQGNPKHNPAYTNWYMMDSWVREYGVLNGIALTDTLGSDLFLLDFRKTFATLFSGVRHDSGDPFEWGWKIIRHYQSLGIDPITKTLLFSDGLDFEKATKLYRTFKPHANVAFGIGTYLSNPLDNPLNIVMKITKVDGSPVAKLSDTPGKTMIDDKSYLDWLKACIDRRLGSNA